MYFLLLGLHYFIEDTNCINGTIVVFQFPDHSLFAGSEASMVTRIWDTSLESNAMTSYANTAALMKKYLILTIVGWEAAAKILDQWLIVVTVLLGLQEHNPA